MTKGGQNKPVLVRKEFVLIVAVLIILSLAIIKLSLFHEQIKFKDSNNDLENAVSYIRHSLMNVAGLLETYPHQATTIPGREEYRREALSESAGLWLEVLESLGNRKEFDSQLVTLRNFFRLPNQTFSWRLEIGQKDEARRNPSSATVDDLRVVGALLSAAERWGSKPYEAEALKIAQAIKKEAVYQNHLLHQPTPPNGSRLVILSYLDLKTMEKLVRFDPEWTAIFENSKALLLKGMRTNGFFYDRYDVSRGIFFDEERNLIHQLICAIQLVESGFSVEGLLAFLRSEWQTSGKLYGRYNPDTREPTVSYESIAVYALTAELALKAGDKKLAGEMSGRILKMTRQQKYSLWKGALCDGPCHSFDHLQALRSLLLMGSHEK